MQDACFKSRVGEGPFRSQMVVPRSFDNHDGVLNAMLLLSLANLHHGQLEEGRLMLQCLGLDEQVSEVVGHHPFRAMFCGIDTHDGELLTAHLLHAMPDDTPHLLHAVRVTRI